MQRLIENILRRRLHRSTYQKAFLGYTAVLLVALILIPLMRVQELDAVSSHSIRFFGSSMLKLQILVVLIFLKLIALNSSPKRKKMMYNLFGYTSNEYLDNALLLIIFFVLILTMGETLGFFTDNISTIVTPTAGFLLIGLLLVGGIVRQLMLTRMQRKKQGKAKTAQANIAHEIDTSKKERQFQTGDKHLQGLFGEEK